MTMCEDYFVKITGNIVRWLPEKTNKLTNGTAKIEIYW